jgi:hypothetical protein
MTIGLRTFTEIPFKIGENVEEIMTNIYLAQYDILRADNKQITFKLPVYLVLDPVVHICSIV